MPPKPLSLLDTKRRTPRAGLRPITIHTIMLERKWRVESNRTYAKRRAHVRDHVSTPSHLLPARKEKMHSSRPCHPLALTRLTTPRALNDEERGRKNLSGSTIDPNIPIPRLDLPRVINVGLWKCASPQSSLGISKMLLFPRSRFRCQTPEVFIIASL
ncbi:hypothetical protein EJ04DRAFT_221052 [Polyplosphaeria fusca]|uniref:Uncharacterized protein n=1 Tax=Polyplosphaeria fusca TaxID=682080 RepID=A0A9P4QYG9_9PLEO|nr:hypothetical protein EJ04DRAFT_221052 [Polyplosphaeria fusca]